VVLEEKEVTYTSISLMCFQHQPMLVARRLLLAHLVLLVFLVMISRSRRTAKLVSLLLTLVLPAAVARCISALVWRAPLQAEGSRFQAVFRAPAMAEKLPFLVVSAMAVPTSSRRLDPRRVARAALLASLRVLVLIWRVAKQLSPQVQARLWQVHCLLSVVEAILSIVAL
jgi:hypothetical protein